MNLKTNEVLDNIREALAAQMPVEPELAEAAESLTEEEQLFCAEGLQMLQAAEYELENFEEFTVEQMYDALKLVAEDDARLAPSISRFLDQHGVTVTVEG